MWRRTEDGQMRYVGSSDQIIEHPTNERLDAHSINALVENNDEVNTLNPNHETGEAVDPLASESGRSSANNVSLVDNCLNDNVKKFEDLSIKEDTVKNTDKKEEQICIICRCDHATLEKTKCGHLFHSECLYRSCTIGQGVVCPLCRRTPFEMEPIWRLLDAHIAEKEECDMKHYYVFCNDCCKRSSTPWNSTGFKQCRSCLSYNTYHESLVLHSITSVSPPMLILRALLMTKVKENPDQIDSKIVLPSGEIMSHKEYVDFMKGTAEFVEGIRLFNLFLDYLTNPGKMDHTGYRLMVNNLRELCGSEIIPDPESPIQNNVEQRNYEIHHPETEHVIGKFKLIARADGCKFTFTGSQKEFEEYFPINGAREIV